MSCLYHQEIIIMMMIYSNIGSYIHISNNHNDEKNIATWIDYTF